MYSNKLMGDTNKTLPEGFFWGTATGMIAECWDEAGTMLTRCSHLPHLLNHYP